MGNRRNWCQLRDIQGNSKNQQQKRQAMNFTVDPTIFLATLIMLFLGVISFFLKSLVQQIKEMSKEGVKRGNEIHEIRVEVKSVIARVVNLEKDVDRYNVDIPEFYKEFPSMIKSAMQPQIDLILHKIDQLEKKK